VHLRLVFILLKFFFSETSVFNTETFRFLIRNILIFRDREFDPGFYLRSDPSPGHFGSCRRPGKKILGFFFLGKFFGPMFFWSQKYARFDPAPPPPASDISTDLQAARQGLGYCPQFDALLDLMTVEEHLALYCAGSLSKGGGTPRHHRVDAEGKVLLPGGGGEWGWQAVRSRKDAHLRFVMWVCESDSEHQTLECGFIRCRGKARDRRLRGIPPRARGRVVECVVFVELHRCGIPREGVEDEPLPRCRGSSYPVFITPPREL